MCKFNRLHKYLSYIKTNNRRGHLLVVFSFCKLSDISIQISDTRSTVDIFLLIILVYLVALDICVINLLLPQLKTLSLV